MRYAGFISYKHCLPDSSGSSEVKRPSADVDAVVTTRRRSYVRMGDPEDRRMSRGKKRRSSAKEDVWDVTMDIEEEVEYVPWSGMWARVVGRRRGGLELSVSTAPV